MTMETWFYAHKYDSVSHVFNEPDLSWTIRSVEIESSSDGHVVKADGKRFARMNDHGGYFRSFQSAKDFLIWEYEWWVTRAQEELNERLRIMGSLKALEPR